MSPAAFSTPRLNSLLTLSLLCCLLFVASSDDLTQLLKIKIAFQTSKTDVFSSWQANNLITSFSGITCNEAGFVTEIELSHQHLTGNVPFHSICELKSLEKLSLGANSLYGPLTPDLNNCTQLQYLDLGNNFFSGSVPDISSLTKLLVLHMNYSGISGTFPWTSLQKMTNLTVFSLGDNALDQSAFPEEVTELKELTWLYLSNCSIEGKISRGIGSLTKLENLELADNYISGEIPAEISNLVNLWQLELYNNELNGTFPPGFGNLTKLRNFDAMGNFIEGDLSELRFLNQLVSLQIHDNQLTGQVPEEFGEFKHFVNISLYGNKLTGSLPQMLGSWSDFEFIDVSENFLTGPIPPDMCKNGKMSELLILQNNFTGEIPENYARCRMLRRFRVSNNSLSGRVPSGIWGLPNLNIIDVAMNNLEGPITPEIRNASSLTELYLGNNHFSGELPLEILEASSLVSVDLSNNQFSGQIPRNIGKLNQLMTLHLEVNDFTGSIPDSVESCESLSELNMAHNSISGKIPSNLGSIRTLNSLNLSNNQIAGKIPRTLSFSRISLLDLSHNKLTGRIPKSLSVAAYNGSFTGNDGLCSENIKFFRLRCSTSMSRETQTLIACFSVVLFGFLVSLACYFYLKKRRDNKIQNRSPKKGSWNLKSFSVLSFTEDQIIDSIKQENVIGKGGSGNVYRVQLPNGTQLAVKHIWNSDIRVPKKIQSSSTMLQKDGHKTSSEYDSEVKMLSAIRHVNVVKLYCSITSEDSSLLVYEYMPHGSLWDQLHSNSGKGTLDWDKRYKIAVGSAKGLAHLHHGCHRPVIHRDVKSSNILLDEFLRPRIADFGLAKVVQSSSTYSTHVIAGTFGYIAPEYGYTYKINEKSDVYSFGVVLMELVTGKRPLEPDFGTNKDIVSWVCSKLTDKDGILSIIDLRMNQDCRQEAVKVLKIAILCTSRLPALRPTMRNVVQMLEDAEPCRLIGVLEFGISASKKENL
ncbi:receptor-like protein kinase HAIKU2 [Heracleum sosnowskyi]|uniref:non-specific serine/threonine protein kinase n=1 Tax=Heracleum sosnowskyi TaxID=360622 RepID=A0AAD8J298_9APIA|nr:receptor-like protein kinase HAIKU2 [Heracleum sosnowskyi]